jgi:hypothetical protein
MVLVTGFEVPVFNKLSVTVHCHNVIAVPGVALNLLNVVVAEVGESMVGVALPDRNAQA